MGSTVGVYIIKRRGGSFFLSRGGEGWPLTPGMLSEVNSFGGAVFADLDSWGLDFVSDFAALYARSWRVQAFRLRIYAVWCDGVQVRCYRALGAGSNDPEVYLKDLNALLLSVLGYGIRSQTLISIGSVGAAIINSRAPHLLVNSNDLGGEGERYILSGGISKEYLPGSYQKLLYYDFPNMYGSIMAEGISHGYVPVGARAPASFITPEYIYEAVVNVDIDSPGQFLFVNQETGAVFCTGAELGACFAAGGSLVRIVRAWEPQKSATGFSELVGGLIRLRSAGNSAAKPCVNSFFGRFGARNSAVKTRLIHLRELPLEPHAVSVYKTNGRHALVEYPNAEEYRPNKNIFVAASVTSRARARVNALAHKLHLSGRRVVAIRTDAVYYTGDPYGEFFSGALSGAVVGENSISYTRSDPA